jgi:hypothetical protein
MIDFPIGDLMDEDAWWHWLTDHLHPDGRRCPRCHAQERRVAQHNTTVSGRLGGVAPVTAMTRR